MGVEEAGELFSEILASHLQHHDVICAPKQYHPRAIMKRPKEKNIKRTLREDSSELTQSNPKTKSASTTESRSPLREPHSSEAQATGKSIQEEPWSFSKSACCPKPQTKPTLTMETGLSHFQSSFEASNGHDCHVT